MARNNFLGCIFFLIAFFSWSQPDYSPAVYKYHKKNYFVYPVRSSNLEDIPPTGFNLPDGNYIVFTDYDFKNKFLSGEQKLRDTTKISAILEIKNNLPNGEAIFYFYDYNFLGNKEKKKPSSTTTGSFLDGLKEGKWKDFTGNKISVIRNFKSGLLHGYVLSYDLNGKLERKEKFNNDRACDTVFYYNEDGSMRMMYDIFDALNDTSEQPPENFNDFILHSTHKSNIIGSAAVVKSFFKSFSENGKVQNFIRFTNGKNPVFDTLYIGGGSEKMVLKEFKKPGEESKHLVELYFDVINSESGRESNVRYEYYDGYDLYMDRFIRYNDKTKKTDSTVFSMIDIKKLNYDSWTDTVIAISCYNNEVSKIHFIPALGYSWIENPTGNVFKPRETDGIKQEVQLTDTFDYSPSKIQKVREIAYRQYTKPGKKKLMQKDFRKYDFLPGVSDIRVEEYFRETVTHYNDPRIKEVCNEFLGSEKSSMFLNNGLPLSGKIILTNSKKLSQKKIFETKPVFSSRIYTTLQRSCFVNGKREGTMELLIKSREKGITSDFEKSFWNKPETGDNYIIAHYKNGLLDGNLKEYFCDNFLDEKTLNHQLLLKKFAVLYKDINYNNGLADGPYKEYSLNGKLKLAATLHEGKFDEAVTLYRTNGTKQIECELKDDLLHGNYFAFEEGGTKISEAHFENNRLNGDYVVYGLDTNGKSANSPILIISADNNVLKFKKTFGFGNQLLEELKFGDQNTAEFCADMARFENFLETRKRETTIEDEEKMFASYKSYYENGNILCEGEIAKGFPKGKWNFYNVRGILINEVFFSDTTFLPKGGVETKHFYGTVTGYFNNGKLRCKGFMKDWESGYDCATHTDKTKFGIFYSDAWLYDGSQIIKNGTGKGIISDENGNKISSGEYLDYKEEGVWKYFDLNEKLNETGKYIHGEKDGLWYSGDLENLNFEDGACFDPADKEAMKQLEYSKKQISLTTELYKNGVLMDSETFETDLNKERDGKIRTKF